MRILAVGCVCQQLGYITVMRVFQLLVIARQLLNLFFVCCVVYITLRRSKLARSAVNGKNICLGHCQNLPLTVVLEVNFLLLLHGVLCCVPAEARAYLDVI
jgi:hypothetical protein